LTGKPRNPDVGKRDIVTVDLLDVGDSRHGRPVLGKHRLAEGVDLTLKRDLKAMALKGKVASADA
jgi:hypothetical protein